MFNPTTIRRVGYGRLVSVYTNWISQPDDLQRVYVVQGKKASLNEYNVALGLDTLAYEYVFQLAIMGGRQQLGGVLLDFLVLTLPYPTPLWVHGEYWHSGAQRQTDLFQQALVEAEMGGQIAPALEIWGDQSETPELALAWLRRNLG
jgi:hypothetical protein